ncbi:hypothetical protein P7C70_g4233, partial [Phenoliferia sp. Uapishka_3]
MFATTPFRAGQDLTLQHQKSLPRLPIPTLPLTFARYTKSLRPLVLQTALVEGKSPEYVEEEIRKREEWADDFMKVGGLGRVLQERLKDVDRTTPSNWLDDGFWLKVAYHGWRVPLPINSNWWLLMADDQNIPEAVRNGIPNKGEFTEWQVKRAAKLVERMTLFKLRLDRCFGVTRIPKLPTDELVYSPHPHPSTHVTVLANDNFYNLQVLADGEVVPLETLEAQIWAIADDATARGTGEGVSVLSGDNRDDWTTSREHLLALDPQNRKSLTEIENSLFLLALDSSTAKSEKYVSSSPTRDTTDLDAHIVAASSGHGTGRNRWWDKAMTLVVENNGRGSMIGEHSPVDALIPSTICDFVLAESVGEQGASMRGQAVAPVEKLDWVVDQKTKDSIIRAQRVVEAVAKDSDGKMLWFDEYGADWIKKVGKHSPDAYLQMVLQLAYYKTHGTPVATYETASTRLFLHGRTEVIRTLSEDSWHWVQAMTEQPGDFKNCYELLTNATKAHNTFTRDSSTGKGCDRHLMGLKLLLREGESHPIFDDPLYAESSAWVLSTSGLSAGDRFYGTGFGTVWPNGYGINYLAGSKVVKFGIESKRSCEETSTAIFRDNVVAAMRQMREVCEKGQAEPLAKL